MFKILCVCIFVAKYANGFYYDFKNENTNEEDEKRKMFSFFHHSPWSVHYVEPMDLRFGLKFQPPITIIEPSQSEKTYRTQFSIQQATHPYLYQIMQMLPIKGQQSYQYIYQKLFQYFLALQKFGPMKGNSDKIIHILRFVFPELGPKIYELAKCTPGPQLLKALFEVIFPKIPKHDLEMIFKDAQTTNEVIINLVLYLCPNLRNHFLWNANLPVNEQLTTMLKILFPGEIPLHLLNNNTHQEDPMHNFYTFLDLLFKGKLIPSTTITQTQPEGPEWLHFQNILHQNNINYEMIPRDILFFLFANYKSPQFNIYLNQFKNKLEQEKKPNKMDPHTLSIWLQYLNDLKTYKKTLNDMPPEIKLFLQQNENPQELIKILSESLGFPVDTSKLNIPLDPQIQDLWKKFIFDILNHKGDTAHLPKQLLDYFNSLSQNPNYKLHLDIIFDALSINPKIAIEWNNFFDKLQNGQTSLDKIPADLIKFLTNHQHPEEFLRLILKLKDSKINTNFLNVHASPKIMALWKKFIEDVAANRGNIRNIPEELLQYFYKLTSNPENLEYIKLLFAPDRIQPYILNAWNQFINDLKSHKVDLNAMPSEIIQLMLKYKSPDDFFKVLLPQTNIEVNPNVVPDDTVKDQWRIWTENLRNRNVSILDTPKELKDFFQHISPSKNYQTTLNEINSINPDLLVKWKEFMQNLRQHNKSLFTIPEDLKKYLLQMRSPQEFVNLIFKALDPPLDRPIPAPSPSVVSNWEKFLKDLAKSFNLNGQDIDSTTFPLDFSKYLRDASDDVNYKHAVNSIYQMDKYVKNGFEDFKQKMLNDYRVTLADLPQKLVYFFLKFEDPADMLRSILAAYSDNFHIKSTPKSELNPEYFMMWAKSLQDLFSRHKTEIIPFSKDMIKYLTKDTPLEREIDRVIKLHESNALVKRVEDFWQQSKNEIKFHDGLEVFLQFLDKLGYYYGKSEELCEERTRILEVLDRVRQGFAAKSKCTKLH